MIDLAVRKPAVIALLAACVGVLTIVMAHTDVPVHAGVIGPSAATKAVLVDHAPASATRGGSGVPMQPDWSSSGQNNHNTRSAAAEHAINAGNVRNLKTAWIFTTSGDVSATATIVNGVAYVRIGVASSGPSTPGPEGHLVARCQRIHRNLGLGLANGPAYWNGELVIGTGNLMTSGLSPAFEIGIDARSGAMLWRTRTDANIAAIVTGSATIDNGIVYTGVSSKTEHTTVTPTFRGSVEALDARTGKILWKTYMVPAGFNGGAVWSSQPVVDHKTGMLYVTTGNSYSVPKGYCVNPGETNCTQLPLDADIDSVVALRLTTGKIVWAHHTLRADTWTMADPNASPDFDFGADPNLYTTTIEGKRTDVLGAGQKSGMYYALDPATGKEIWATQAGPGGVLGGIEWGTSSDGERIYAAITNGSHKAYTYITYDGQKKTTRGGLWTALDAATGKILWQTADPQGSSTSRMDLCPARMVSFTQALRAGISMPWTQGLVGSSGPFRAAEPYGRARQS